MNIKLGHLTQLYSNQIFKLTFYVFFRFEIAKQKLDFQIIKEPNFPFSLLTNNQHPQLSPIKVPKFTSTVNRNHKRKNRRDISETMKTEIALTFKTQEVEKIVSKLIGHES